MKIVFDVEALEGDVFRVILSSGDDAFFASERFFEAKGIDVDIVEIDLERVKGENPATLSVLRSIADGIGRCFMHNQRAVLYYYCDDMNDVPSIGVRNQGMWPQEYRSQLFGLMFRRYVEQNNLSEDIVDVSITIQQDARPLYMHLIARNKHVAYLEQLKEYIIENFGK